MTRQYYIQSRLESLDNRCFVHRQETDSILGITWRQSQSIVACQPHGMAVAASLLGRRMQFSLWVLCVFLWDSIFTSFMLPGERVNVYTLLANFCCHWNKICSFHSTSIVTSPFSLQSWVVAQSLDFCVMVLWFGARQDIDITTRTRPGFLR